MPAAGWDASLTTPLCLVTLLNFCWQAALIVVAALGIAGCFPPRWCRARYLVYLGALALLTAAPLWTIIHYLLDPQALRLLAGSTPEPVTLVDGAAVAVESRLETIGGMLLGWFNQHRTLWLAGWLLGATACSLRMAISLRYCRRLRLGKIRLPGNLERIAERLAEQMQVAGRVTVAASRDVSQAVAIGLLKPVILIPMAWISELPLPTIEAILAHELAHIRRHDLWVNAWQRSLESVFFFHPLVWLLSRRLTQEREMCCDQLAIQLTGQPLKYVEALARVAGASDPDLPPVQFGTAFFGGRRMKLLRRAQMILEPTAVGSGSPLKNLTLLAGIGLLISGGSFAWSTAPEPALLPPVVQDGEDSQPIRVHVRRQDGESNEFTVIVEEESRLQDVDEQVVHLETLHSHLRQLHLDGKQVDHAHIAAQLRKLADQLESGHRSHAKRGEYKIEVKMDDDHSRHGSQRFQMRQLPNGVVHWHSDGQGDSAAVTVVEFDEFEKGARHGQMNWRSNDADEEVEIEVIATGNTQATDKAKTGVFRWTSDESDGEKNREISGHRIVHRVVEGADDSSQSYLILDVEQAGNQLEVKPLLKAQKQERPSNVKEGKRILVRAKANGEIEKIDVKKSDGTFFIGKRNEVKQDESLDRMIDELKSEIGKLRKELDGFRGSQTEQTPGDSQTQTFRIRTRKEIEEDTEKTGRPGMIWIQKHSGTESVEGHRGKGVIELKVEGDVETVDSDAPKVKGQRFEYRFVPTEKSGESDSKESRDGPRRVRKRVRVGDGNDENSVTNAEMLTRLFGANEKVESPVRSKSADEDR